MTDEREQIYAYQERHLQILAQLRGKRDRIHCGLMTQLWAWQHSAPGSDCAGSAEASFWACMAAPPFNRRDFIRREEKTGQLQLHTMDERDDRRFAPLPGSRNVHFVWPGNSNHCTQPACRPRTAFARQRCCFALAAQAAKAESACQQRMAAWRVAFYHRTIIRYARSSRAAHLFILGAAPCRLCHYRGFHFLRARASAVHRLARFLRHEFRQL